MKSAIFVAILFAFTVSISLSSPSIVRAGTQCDLTNTNTIYFGYYGTTSPESISEIVSMNNSNMILTSGWGGAAYYPSYTGKFLVDLGAGMLGQDGKFYPDWETVGIARLQSAVSTYNDRVYAFYYDEPFWNNISREQFRSVTKKLRETFPSIGILAIEAYPPILNHTIPTDYFEYVTDLGFDYYFTYYDANNDDGWQKYLSIHDAFKPYLVGKKLWLIPDGHAPTLNPPYWRWSDAFNRYVCFANTQSETIGIMTYTYKSFPQYTEAKDLLDPSSTLYDATYRTQHLSVGRQALANNNARNYDATVFCPQYIDPENSGYCQSHDNSCIFYSNGCIQNQSCKTPLATCTSSRDSNRNNLAGDLNQDGTVNIMDFNLLVTHFNTIYNIFDFNDIVRNFGQNVSS